MLSNSLLESKPVKKYKDTGEPMIDLASQTFVYPDDFEYRVAEVTEATEARPDILSSSIYGSDKYGDLICKLNGIQNPFELSIGTRLIVPLPESIKLFFTRETEEFDDFGTNDNQYGKPKPKRKNERRRPNEAVLGDVRYKIDKASKIIYY